MEEKEVKGAKQGKEINSVCHSYFYVNDHPHTSHKESEVEEEGKLIFFSSLQNRKTLKKNLKNTEN